jgi:hypothetical protein
MAEIPPYGERQGIGEQEEYAAIQAMDGQAGFTRL